MLQNMEENYRPAMAMKATRWIYWIEAFSR